MADRPRGIVQPVIAAVVVGVALAIQGAAAAGEAVSETVAGLWGRRQMRRRRRG